ncbi:class I SAM-dependent methyltransferase [Roseomonas frigidaquae]|uniref:Class I SAM-dependent methyltransferase n=1 Tax=Falsiroseomonas frigidaquae TaxID=487318 RepID=A0ABX1EWW6_9PROT|nr:class I SAM-dependent methyltransferase [Falsiroseomonas frigidaquae]NKE44582.1 class I SAM-dependent methyltransferase [Falsiroseomonas frigidaquae]
MEGSDAPLRAQRAEWRLLHHNLFTGDITRPFTLRPSSPAGPAAPPVACDIISAWEVMQHIADADLPGLFAKLHTHLKPDGPFVGSIALGRRTTR